jgi:hypothetical protein
MLLLQEIKQEMIYRHAQLTAPHEDKKNAIHRYRPTCCLLSKRSANSLNNMAFFFFRTNAAAQPYEEGCPP